MDAPDIFSLSRNANDKTATALAKVFRRYDAGAKGHLDGADLKVAMLFLFGYKPSKSEIAQLLTQTDDDNAQGMKLARFQRLMAARLTDACPAQETRHLFQAFDTRCQGYLTVEDVKRAFRSTAPGIAESTVASCFNQACRNPSGKMSFREFEVMMTHTH